MSPFLSRLIPGDKAGYRPRPNVCLKFIVVGGGNSGLATACALKQAGHEVLLLERGNGKIISRGGIQAPPNMTRLLYKWGLKPALSEKAHKCDRFVFKNGNSGEWVGSMVMDEEFLKDLIADFLFVQHEDLHSILQDHALSEGVKIRYNCNVVDADPVGVSVTLESGEKIFADVVIGADGYDSTLRPIVTEADDLPSPTARRHLVATYTIPVDVMKEDEDLGALLSMEDWVVWMGDGYILTANVCHGGSSVTVTITQNYSRPQSMGEEEWTEEHNLEWHQVNLENFEPRLQKLLKLAKTVSSRVFVTRIPPDDIVSGDSRMVLVGMAAHPILPGSNHCTSLAIEDAQTLGCLFSRVRNREQISQLLTAYEEIRHPRSVWIQDYDFHHHETMKFPVGPMQDQRDALLRQTMAYGDWDHMDEATFRSVWGNELTIYSHDATEKVDDWWGQWGALILRGGTPDISNLEISVSTGDMPNRVLVV